MFVKIKTDPIVVRYFATKKEATASGNDGNIVGSPEDISGNVNLRTSDLLAVFNEVAGEKVARFSDRASGAKRLWGALVAKAPKRLAEEETGTASEAPKTAQEKASKSDGAKAVRKPARARKARAEGSARGPREDGPRNQVMTPTTTINPYRNPSQSFTTFALVAKKPGHTYHEYVEMGGRGNTLAGMIANGYVKLSKRPKA